MQHRGGPVPGPRPEGETLLDMADQAMYRVKRSGKNRFLFTEEPLTAPPGQE